MNADQDTLLCEQVTDGSSITRKWCGFTDREILFPLFGALASGLTLSLQNLGFSLDYLLPAVPAPFLISIFLLLTFVHKKPPHYAIDWSESVLYGRNYLASSQRIYSHAPNGAFGRDVIIWGDWGNGAWAGGLELDVPPYDYSRNGEKNHLKHRLDHLLRFLAGEGLRAQFYWMVDSDYSRELEDYAAATAVLAPDSHCRKYREERHRQYVKKADARQLRRERLVLFISARLPGRIGNNMSLHQYDERSKQLLAETENEAHRRLQQVGGFLETLGVKVKCLDANALCDVLRRYYNPSLSLAEVKFKEGLHDNTVKDQVLFSDITPSRRYSFVLDGQSYCVFALQAPLPQQVYLGMINALTKLGILDYSISCTVIPYDRQKAIQEEEHAINILQGQLSQEKAPASLQHAHSRRHEMVMELAEGRSCPMEVQYMISVHAPDDEELEIKATAIKAALARLGIGYYLLTEPRGAINAFFQATPSWMWGPRSGHKFRTLDKYASPLLPFSSTYLGRLHGAEAIYNGEQFNLVGLKQFAGDIRTDSDPQHAILFGKTGSGKSVLTADLIMQTHGFYGYTCIIDYGLSYAALASQLGARPIYLGPSSNVTINYFDTHRMPLTAGHMSLVATVLRVMCDGMASDGMIMRYLRPFYYNHAAEWLQQHREHEFRLAAIAILAERYLASRECDDEVEAWQKAKTEWNNSDLGPEETARFMYHHQDRLKVLSQCFAEFRPEEFPTHTLFVQYLRSKPLPDEENPRLLQEIADALELWQADGKNGRLFDGISNLDLGADFEYFELSRVPANDPNFKFAAGALIQMVAISKIERMDRKVKKRLIIDEANSFFELPQGAKVIEAAMTKFRKHRCSVLISFQQYEMLNSRDIKESVLSNIHQYILMGQSDRNDVDKLGQALGLSDSIRQAVLSFETPANLPPEDRYSAFAQVRTNNGLTGGIARNYMTEEMLRLTGSVREKEHKINSAKNNQSRQAARRDG